MECQNEMSRSLPPEDIRVGQYVAVQHVVHECTPCFCNSDPQWRPLRIMRTLELPWKGGGVPMRVVEVCLPFVLVQRPNGRHRTLDVRRYRLARVSNRYGQEVFKRVREDREKQKKEEMDDDD